MARKTDYDNGFKFKVALAALKGDRTYEEIATEFNVSKSLVSKWSIELKKNGATVYSEENKSNAKEAKEQKHYQQIGQLSMEVEFLKKFQSRCAK